MYPPSPGEIFWSRPWSGPFQEGAADETTIAVNEGINGGLRVI